MQYIHVTSQQEYEALMDIFEKKGWKWMNWTNPKNKDMYWWISYLQEWWINIYIRNEDKFWFIWWEPDSKHTSISFQDYLKQEDIWESDISTMPTLLKFWDLVDVRDSDSEEWDCKWYYVGTIEWLHICNPYEYKLKKFLWCDHYMDDFAPFRQVRKHEEEKVTITITKSEYEKVKEFLNK